MSTSGFTDPNHCALDSEGNLKDADDIQFFNSEGDDDPMLSTKGKAKAATSAFLSLMQFTFLTGLTLHSGQL
jgi:hypothetical protein